MKSYKFKSILGYKINGTLTGDVSIKSERGKVNLVNIKFKKDGVN